MTNTLPKSVIDAINSCFVDMATPIIGQERPLLVSYDSIKERMKEHGKGKGNFAVWINVDGVKEAYASDWVVQMIPGWGYSFTPKATVFG